MNRTVGVFQHRNVAAPYPVSVDLKLHSQHRQVVSKKKIILLRVTYGLIYTFIPITAVQKCVFTAETDFKPNHGTTAITTHPELNR